MPLLNFGEWRPDVSDYESATTQNVVNVLPRGDGYGPFPSLLALSVSLGAQCRGAFVAYKADGSVTIFAATATDLYMMVNTNFGWTKLSKAGGPYPSVSSGEQWRFGGNGMAAVARRTLLTILSVPPPSRISPARRRRRATSTSSGASWCCRGC